MLKQLKVWFDSPVVNESGVIKSVEQGASTTVWAAVAPELEGKGGLYLENCAIAKPATKAEVGKNATGYVEYAVNKENAKKLFDISMEWLKNPPK